MLLLALFVPFGLLGLLLVMGWIEAPLRSESLAEGLPEFLERASPEEIEVYVSSGLKPALERYWLSRRMRALLPGR